MAKRKPPVNPLVDQAATATHLRYDPELQALATLRTSARGDYLDASKQARLAAQIIAAGNQQSSGGLADFLTRINAHQPTVTPSKTEAQILASNLGLTGEAAGAGLYNSSKRAFEGAQYQQAGLQRQYGRAAGQLDDRARQIAGESGSFLADYYNKLLDSQQQQEFKASESAKNRLNSRITAGVTASGTVIPGGKADKPPKPVKHTGTLPGGAKPASNSAYRTFQTNYQAGVTYAKAYEQAIRTGKMSTATALTLITDGIPKETRTEYLRDPATGKIIKNANGSPKTHQVTDPGAKGIKDPIAARAALEQVLHGGVTKAVVDALHGQGIKLARVGLKPVSAAKVKRDVGIRKTLNTVKNLI